MYIIWENLIQNRQMQPDINVVVKFQYAFMQFQGSITL